MIDGRVVVVGKAAFVAERLASGTIAPVALAPGQMGVYVGVDGEYAGAILLLFGKSWVMSLVKG